MPLTVALEDISLLAAHPATVLVRVLKALRLQFVEREYGTPRSLGTHAIRIAVVRCDHPLFTRLELRGSPLARTQSPVMVHHPETHGALR
jgi:hypothetical protein